MCIKAAERIPSRFFCAVVQKSRSKRTKLRVHRLTRRKRSSSEEMGRDMELKNLKLYLENKSIIEENEKLKKKAILLHQENLALMSELQKKFSHLDSISTTLLLLLHKQ